MENNRCIFGTDGVRDRAGEGYLAAESVARLARATAWTLEKKAAFSKDFPKDRLAPEVRMVIIGRDTRASGKELEKIIAATLNQAGFPVTTVGVVTTPGVAYLAAERREVSLGIMISASHNPAEYNGIKYLAPTGAKISPQFEEEVSSAYWNGREYAGGSPARTESDPNAVDDYVRFLVRSCRHPEVWRSCRVVVDGANGAAVHIAPRALQALGAEVVAIGNQPDGKNINDHCGALYPEELSRRVLREQAAFGFAFDGDGDRMIPVTENGTILDGDYVLAIAGRTLHRQGKLPAKAVVATVMSNIGLEKALAEDGLRLLRTAVGDRFVYEAMVEAHHPLGGEQSGHLIFLEDAQTGDGILAAIRLVDCLGEGGNGTGEWSLEKAAQRMRKYPQILINYQVARKVPLAGLPAVQAAIARAERTLGGDGRVVVRYSGTEPLIRVMVEGPEKALIERLAGDIGVAAVECI